MKHTTLRKLAGIAAIVTLASCTMLPMGITASAADITINGISATVPHTFEVYQIFSGKLAADGTTLTEIKWGSGITTYDSASVTPGESVSEDIITEITTTNDALATLELIGLGTAAKTATSNGESLTISDLADGYYVIKDTTNLTDKDDANSAWIVQIAGETATTEIEIKEASPSVDKQVLDETADAEAGATEGWGESADHAINETFQFKLTATIPADGDYKYYESYKLVFNDTLADGVVYDGNVKVTVNGTEITDGFVVEGATAGTTTNATFTITIDNLIPLLADDDALGNDTVVVTYDAHLNADAQIDNSSVTSTTNKNTVYLTYSNNPDSTGTGTMGQTPSDSVWVFTYQVNNTKYSDSVAQDKVLDGAGFTLYSGSTAIKLIDNGDGTYTVADQDATEGYVTEMTSSNGGIFNIKGLDAGEYKLVETTIPDGYNKCEDQDIVIKATHLEDASGASAANTLTSDSTMKLDIINKSGSALPSTGGIGTTLFYVVGGTMAVGAGVYLIAKKRMNNNEE